ncbi:MAG: hypothetical protein LEGION0398_MBIBDBAK_00972 [Legionellaceae bacterium]
MSLKRGRFKPSFKLTIMILCLLPLLIGMGIWQLKRAEFKKQQQNQYRESLKVNPTLLSTLSIPKNFSRVKLNGKFDTQHIIYIDNKIYHHKIGYYVLIPFLLTQNNKAVLINIGFITQGKSRQELPSILLNSDTQSLMGIINEYPKKSFFLGKNSDPSFTSWPMRLQYPNREEIQNKLGYSIEPFMILLDTTGNSMGLICDWDFTSMMNPEKHLAYAFQWFAMAGTLILLYIISGYKNI